MFYPPENATPADILEMTASTFEPNWYLFARCHCKSTQLTLGYLAREYGGEQRLIELIERMRCKTCRQPPSRTDLWSGPLRERTQFNMQLTG